MRPGEASQPASLGERLNVFETHQACLIVFDDQRNEAVFPLCEDRTIFIGRSRGVDVRIEDSAISNFHAAVFRHEDAWFVRDLDSTNGTCLNGKPVRQERLRPNDRIEIAGAATLFFTDRGFRMAPPAPAAPAAAGAPAPEGAPHPETTDLEGFLGDLANVYAVWASEAGRRVALAVAPRLPTVRLDAAATTRVLDSFIRSALRRSPRGGCVRISAAVANDRVEVGIAGEALPFEPAETEKLLALLERELPGVIDNLAHAQGAMVRRGGPGGAARFTLSFPIAGPPVRGR